MHSWSLLTRGGTAFAKGNVLTVLHSTKSRILSFLVLKSITCINPMFITHSKNLHVAISLTIGHGIFQFIFGKLKSPQEKPVPVTNCQSYSSWNHSYDF